MFVIVLFDKQSVLYWRSVTFDLIFEGWIKQNDTFSTLIENCVLFPPQSDLFYRLTVAVEGYCCTWSYSDTRESVGLLWTRDRPDAETCTWQHTPNSQQTDSYTLEGFEPAIPAMERPQTCALDRAATVEATFLCPTCYLLVCQFL